MLRGKVRLPCHSPRSPKGFLHRGRLSTWRVCRPTPAGWSAHSAHPPSWRPHSPGGLPWAAPGPQSRSAGSGSRARDISALRLQVPRPLCTAPPGRTGAEARPKGRAAWAAGPPDPARGRASQGRGQILSWKIPGPRAPFRTLDKLSSRKGRASQTP